MSRPDSIYTRFKRSRPGRTTEMERLADKYPVIRGRDFGDRRTVENIACELADILDRTMGQPNHAEFCEAVDREFLFGCWGDYMREVLDANFARDVRGILFAMYTVGMTRGIASLAKSQAKKEQG